MEWFDISPDMPGAVIRGAIEWEERKMNGILADAILAWLPLASIRAGVLRNAKIERSTVRVEVIDGRA